MEDFSLLKGKKSVAKRVNIRTHARTRARKTEERERVTSERDLFLAPRSFRREKRDGNLRISSERNPERSRPKIEERNQSIKHHAMTTTTRDDQQQQQQQRSTARRDQLTSYQTIAQKSWQDSKVFEVHSDETKPIKFFGNFPYPYMNGLLHLGHAFSLSKLVRFFCYRYYSLRVIRSLSFVRLFLCVCRRRSRAFFSFGV